MGFWIWVWGSVVGLASASNRRPHFESIPIRLEPLTPNRRNAQSAEHYVTFGQTRR